MISGALEPAGQALLKIRKLKITIVIKLSAVKGKGVHADFGTNLCSCQPPPADIAPPTITECVSLTMAISAATVDNHPGIVYARINSRCNRNAQFPTSSKILR